jgi:hypothetical protein
MEARIEEYVEKVKSGLSCLQKVGFWVEFLHQAALTMRIINFRTVSGD